MTSTQSPANTRNILSVAKEILHLSKKNESVMVPLKLMKLTYIAHGIKLAVTGEPMFKEAVEAWRYGPVIRELYEETKEYGSSDMPFNSLDSKVGKDVEPNAVDTKVIELVLAKWGDKSGAQLSSATHQENTPWYKVWHEDGGQYTSSSIISNQAIEQHYKEIFNI